VPGPLSFFPYSGYIKSMDEHSEPETTPPSPNQSDELLHEFMQELRVVLPGVQVLFAFLLTVPFSQRFYDLSQLQQNVFYASLLCTTAATLLPIAPSAHQRLLWHQGEWTCPASVDTSPSRSALFSQFNLLVLGGAQMP
jgi:hypothetical protein